MNAWGWAVVLVVTVVFPVCLAAVLIMSQRRAVEGDLRSEGGRVFEYRGGRWHHLPPPPHDAPWYQFGVDNPDPPPPAAPIHNRPHP